MILALILSWALLVLSIFGLILWMTILVTDCDDFWDFITCLLNLIGNIGIGSFALYLVLALT